jgi:Xaa-Pro aminopeptidase
MHTQLAELGAQPAWHKGHCPTVSVGPDSPVGHVGATKHEVARGQILHFDFGVKLHDYCADLQRVVYFLSLGEIAPPPPVQSGFDTVVRAIEAAVAAMKPGVLGKEVDAVARSIVTGGAFLSKSMAPVTTSAAWRMMPAGSWDPNGNATEMPRTARWSLVTYTPWSQG